MASSEPAPLPRRLSEALDRLILSEAAQEHAGLKKPPRIAGRARRAGRVSRLFQLAERFGLNDPGLSGPRLTFLYLVLVAGLRLVTGALWRMGPRSVGPFARERARSHHERARDVAGYVTTASRENHVLRLSILLRLLGRRAAAVRLLVARLRSPLTRGRATRELALLLTQAGDGKAATLLPPADEDATAPARRHVPARLRYGVVVLAMFDTPVLRSSLRSLMESDFTGRVVLVEEGHDPAEACRALCESLGVTYIKNPTWSGAAAGLNLGIAQFERDTDIALFSHSDVLWPPHWFAHLDRAWSAVFDRDKVGVLNLGYLQIRQQTSPDLLRLFLDGHYDDLVWLLRSMREIPGLMHRVQDAQVKPGEAPFGLGRDPWVDSATELVQFTGRFAVGASFPVHTWREIGMFDPDLVYVPDLQLLHHNVSRKRWVLSLNNPPLVHLKSSDTEAISADKVAEIGQTFLVRTYEGFQKRFGWQIEHFLNMYFSESTAIYRDQIVAAANESRLGDVDFVFDDFLRRLSGTTLANCELTWCRSRAQCPYV